MPAAVLLAHVATAIVCLGPATLASGAFPRAARAGEATHAHWLHRTTVRYGIASLSVGVLGVASAVLGELLATAWVGGSIVVYLLGVACLLGLAGPAQRECLVALDAERPPARDALLLARAGAVGFAVCWLAVLALMVVRPG